MRRSLVGPIAAGLLVAAGSAAAQVVPAGAWFHLGQAFSARVISVQTRPSIGVGTITAAALPGREFVLLTLEARNDGRIASAPPVLTLGPLISADGSQRIAPDPLTGRANTEASLGNRVHTPVPPGATGRLIALYQVSKGMALGGLYYAAPSDGAAGAPSLVALPH